MRLVIGIVLVLAILPAQAGADDCGALDTQSAMNICSYQTAEASEARMLYIVNRLRARLVGTEHASQFAAAQTAWLSWRSTECEFGASGVAGGTVHPLMLNSCRDALTTARIAELNYYLTCDEGDLSCPTWAGRAD